VCEPMWTTVDRARGSEINSTSPSEGYT